MSPCAPAGMYSHLPFALAQTSIELPYIVIQAVLFATITYWMMELETNPGTLPPPVAFTRFVCAVPPSAALLHVCLTSGLLGAAHKHVVQCKTLPRLSCLCCPGLHPLLHSARGPLLLRPQTSLPDSPQAAEAPLLLLLVPNSKPAVRLRSMPASLS